MALRQLCIIDAEAALWVESKGQRVAVKYLRRYVKDPVFPVVCLQVRKILAHPTGVR